MSDAFEKYPGLYDGVKDQDYWRGQAEGAYQFAEAQHDGCRKAQDAERSLARENAALREARDKDRERLDWLEAQKWGHGRGGWEVKKPESGWALQIIPRGPWHSLREAIDAAMASRAVPPITESPKDA